jgi:hypothetical protein
MGDAISFTIVDRSTSIIIIIVEVPGAVGFIPAVLLLILAIIFPSVSAIGGNPFQIKDDGAISIV